MATNLRSRLLAGCALAWAALLPGLAHAQLVLDPSATQVSSGGQAPVIMQTGPATDITLGASRTILNWSSFNLSSDSAVVFRFQDGRGIVLNRVSGQAVIDGQIESLAGDTHGAGNVWFSAPGGVLIGGNATINVGGLLVTTAQVDAAGFLDAANFNFGFTGAGASRVDVRAGAEVRSGGGPIALIASAVTTEAGSSLTGNGASSVLYGAANDFTVRFAPQPGGLDLLDFVVPAGGGTGSATPLTLAGGTAAGRVFLAVVNRAEVASAVISAPGIIAAQSASTDRGDVVLTAGTGLSQGQPGTTRINTTTETRADFGVVTATRDLLGGFSAPTAVTATRLAAGRDLGLAVAALDVGALNAGRLLAIDATQALAIRESASAGANAMLRTTGAFSVAGGVNALGRLQVAAGTVQAGQLNAGRSVVVDASGAGANNAAAVNVGAALAADDILITTSNAAGSIVLGQATFTGSGADDAPVGRSLVLTAPGTSADITFGAPGGSPLTGATNVVLNGGRDVTISVSNALTLAASSAARTFTIRAMDLDLAGAVTAADLRIESLQGALTLGDGASSNSSSAGASAAALGESPGLLLTDAEFQRITVTGALSLYAGATTGAARGDLIVQNLDVAPSKVPSLLLAAGGSNDVMVPGTLAPGVTGGIVNIGESAADSPWRPGRILVTGAVGFSTGSPDTGYSDVRAFNEVNLNARNDVLIGGPRFIGLVATAPPASIDVARDMPAGVAPTPEEQNHVFVTAGDLTLRASERIVQQNTGTTQKPNGILVTSQQSDALTASRAGVVDLSGAFRNSGGGISGGSLTLDGAGAGQVHYNGCDASLGPCGGTSVVAASTQRTLDNAALSEIVSPATDSDSGDDAATAGLSGAPPEPPPVLSFVDPNADLDAIVTDPVTLGTGSAELWRKKRQPK